MVSDLQWLDFLTFWLCESDLVSVETMLCIWDFDLFPGSWCAGRCSLVVWGRGSEWQLHPPRDHTRPWGCLQCAASPAFFGYCVFVLGSHHVYKTPICVFCSWWEKDNYLEFQDMRWTLEMKFKIIVQLSVSESVLSTSNASWAKL